MYLLSVMDMPNEYIMHVYSLMTGLEIDRCLFYLWMRKRSRLIKLKTREPCVYSIYMNVEAYNTDKHEYLIVVVQCDDLLDIDALKQWKNIANKVAVVRNRDVVIFDVLG